MSKILLILYSPYNQKSLSMCYKAMFFDNENNYKHFLTVIKAAAT